MVTALSFLAWTAAAVAAGYFYGHTNGCMDTFDALNSERAERTRAERRCEEEGRDGE